MPAHAQRPAPEQEKPPPLFREPVLKSSQLAPLRPRAPELGLRRADSSFGGLLRQSLGPVGESLAVFATVTTNWGCLIP